MNIKNIPASFMKTGPCLLVSGLLSELQDAHLLVLRACSPFAGGFGSWHSLGCAWGRGAMASAKSVGENLSGLQCGGGVEG